MTDEEMKVSEELKAALEALIAEAQAMGPGRILTAADRNAVLWVTDREDLPRANRPDCPVGIVPPPGRLH